MKIKLSVLFLLLFGTIITKAQPGKQWITYKGSDGPGKGKNIVLISGDEEYRSEEALPMLARILSKNYGFCIRIG